MNTHTIGSNSPKTKETQTSSRTGSPIRTVSSRDLFQGAHEIEIEHDGAFYRLKITRQGKLILNK